MTPEEEAKLAEVFATFPKAVQAMTGQVIQLRARMDAFEEMFLALQKKRGADPEAIRKALQELQTVYHERYLIHIGDTNPQAADLVDVQGLLAKLIARLESPEES